MSIKRPHERKKAAVRELKHIRIKILDLPTGTVTQWVEHRRDKPRVWIQIRARVRFFYLFRSVLSLLPWRSVGRSNFDRGLHKFNNVNLIKRHTQKMPYIYIYVRRASYK